MTVLGGSSADITDNHIGLDQVGVASGNIGDGIRIGEYIEKKWSNDIWGGFTCEDRK